jgi:sarcosine oxidase, subunit gamma
VAEHPSGAAGSTAPGRDDAQPPRISLGEVKIPWAWNVQGDTVHGSIPDTVSRAIGAPLPLAANTTARSEGRTSFWLGPASWLIVGHTSPPAIAFDAARDALNSAGGALFDVSSSGVVFRIAGERAATALAKSCPLDFHPRTFPDGSCAQSVLGHIGALFYRRGKTEWLLMAPRSYARDAWRLLCISAMEYGYEVTPPAPFG